MSLFLFLAMGGTFVLTSACANQKAGYVYHLCLYECSVNHYCGCLQPDALSEKRRGGDDGLLDRGLLIAFRGCAGYGPHGDVFIQC